jgi:hypothetical protein
VAEVECGSIWCFADSAPANLPLKIQYLLYQKWAGTVGEFTSMLTPPATIASINSSMHVGARFADYDDPPHVCTSSNWQVT